MKDAGRICLVLGLSPGYGDDNPSFDYCSVSTVGELSIHVIDEHLQRVAVASIDGMHEHHYGRTAVHRAKSEEINRRASERDTRE
jgi:hypothetical protein